MSEIFKTISNSRDSKVLRRISIVFAIAALILELMFLTGISENIWVFNAALICLGFFMTFYPLSLLVSLAIACKLLNEAYSALRDIKVLTESLIMDLHSATDSSDKIDISDASAPAIFQWFESELKLINTRSELMEKAVNILKKQYNTIRHD